MSEECRSDRLVSVYNEHWQRVFRLCMSLLRNETDAEDAAQETFTRAVARIDCVYGEVGAYLMTVARHVCYRELARRARRAVELDPELSDDGPSADLQAAERSLLIKVWALLSPRHRTILAHSFAGYSYDEIARITGLSVSAVTSKLWRARQRARELAEGAASVILLPGALWRRGRDQLLRFRASIRARTLNDPTVPTLLAGIQQVALVGTAVVVAGSMGGAAAAPHPPLPAVLASATLPGHVADRSDHAPPTAHGLPARNAAARSATTAVAPPETNWHTDSTLQTRLGGITDPGGRANQQDANVTWVGSSAGSPHTGFLSGFVANDCTGSCQVLFRTDDGGRTWVKVNSTTFPGGEVLVPPSFPASKTIFAVSNPALERSDDGGVTFRKVAPAMAAAIDPTSPSDDTRVVVLSPQPMIYHALTGGLEPGPVLPAGVQAPTAVLVTGDGHILVGGGQPGAQPGQFSTAVERCAGGACVPVLTVPELGVRLAASSTSSSDHTLFAFSPSHLYVSRDDGATFAAVAPSSLPSNIAWASVTTQSACPQGCIFVSGMVGTTADNRLSRDGGATFTTLSALPPLVHGSAFLGDGHLLAALSLGDSHGLGVRCSADLGSAWATYC